MKVWLLYIDPGSGSYLVQAIIAGVLGTLFYFKNIWRRVKFLSLEGHLQCGFAQKQPIEHALDTFFHSASFRDPSGFVFLKKGVVYRQVNHSYAADYELLMQSGLYQRLTEAKLLIPHEEVDENLTGSPDWYKTLLPQRLSFISYAYEWSFGQLKEAADLTLKILEIAMAYGMCLKDASIHSISNYARGSSYL